MSSTATGPAIVVATGHPFDTVPIALHWPVRGPALLARFAISSRLLDRARDIQRVELMEVTVPADRRTRDTIPCLFEIIEPNNAPCGNRALPAREQIPRHPRLARGRPGAEWQRRPEVWKNFSTALSSNARANWRGRSPPARRPWPP